MKSFVFMLIWLPFGACLSTGNVLDLVNLFDLGKFELAPFQRVSYSANFDDDQHEKIVDYVSEAKLIFTVKNEEKCIDETVLEIKSFDEIQGFLDLNASEIGYIKNPCESILVQVETDEKLHRLLNAKIPEQPYLFAAKISADEEFQMYEVQVFSQLIKLIGFGSLKDQTVNYLQEDVIERRSDFNGQPIKMVCDCNGNYGGIMQDTVSAFASRFNFSMEKVPFEGYGALLPHGSWTGTLGQLLNGQIDVSALDLANSPSRLDNFQPGFAFGKRQDLLFFPRKNHGDYSLAVLFNIFNADSRLATTISFLILVTLLVSIAALKKDEMLAFSFEASLVACTKALFGQSFEPGYLMSSSFSKSKSLMILTISLFGSLIYWHYTGVLISSLASPQQVPPIRKLDDLIALQNLRLYTLRDSETNTLVLRWANTSMERMNAFKRIIEPFHFDNVDDVLKIETEDKGFAIIEPAEIVTTAIEGTPMYDHCDFHGVPFIDIPPMVISWMYPKNSILQPIFDSFWLELTERGIYDQIHRRYDSAGHSQCQANATAPVNISFVMLLFLILCVGTVVALVICIGEMVKFRIKTFLY